MTGIHSCRRTKGTDNNAQNLVCHTLESLQTNKAAGVPGPGDIAQRQSARVQIFQWSAAVQACTALLDFVADLLAADSKARMSVRPAAALISDGTQVSH